MDKILAFGEGVLAVYFPRIILALAILFIGNKLINFLIRGIKKALTVKHVDISLQGFLGSLSGIVLRAALFISVAGILGVETTSFVAILAASGLAIGLALQGTLSNFAGGTMILFFKPFRIGDYIEALGHSGTVKEIQIFCTVLHTPDRKTIILPNGPLFSTSIVNYSTELIRRVDMTFGIGYGDDLKKAKNILCEIVESDERVLQDPAYTVAVSALADSSVNFVMRVFVNRDDYWPVFFDMHEKVKLTFDREGISIPFPQRDVHLHQVIT